MAEVTGDGHHFNAVVSAPAFAGLNRIAQHRLVYDVFGAEVGDRIHALSIKTQTFANSGGGPMSDQPTNPMRDAIQGAIAENPVILFMKGNPDAPACGFSARTVAILQSLDTPFAAVDILPDPRIRQELSAISGWPTIPQLFVDGELVGGCDIVIEMYESGELHETLGIEGARRGAGTGRRESSGSAPLSIENRL